MNEWCWFVLLSEDNFHCWEHTFLCWEHTFLCWEHNFHCCNVHPCAMSKLTSVFRLLFLLPCFDLMVHACMCVYVCVCMCVSCVCVCLLCVCVCVNERCVFICVRVYKWSTLIRNTGTRNCLIVQWCCIIIMCCLKFLPLPFFCCTDQSLPQK
jgi:hypothetical protein